MQKTAISRSIYFLLILCFCLPLLTGCESRRIIVNSLEERDANEILVFLSSKSIDATKVQAPTASAGGGSKVILWDISVANKQALEAMGYLNQAGLPRRRSQNLLNIFTGSGLVPSEMEQKIRYQAGLAEQIASTIRKIDGILDAEVQISFAEEDPLNPGKKKQPITASVFVKHNGILDDPNSHLVSKIKRLVAAGVPSLDSGNVTVVGERARSNDMPTDFSFSDHGSSKEYASVWSIIVAKESLTRFRIIFFTFTILLLICVLIPIWMAWKLYPLLKAQGGIKELFHLKPLILEKKQEPKEEVPSTEEERKKEEDAKDHQETDKDLDVT